MDSSDLSLDQQLLKRGFAVLPNFLSQAQLSKTVERYESKAATFATRKIVPCDGEFIANVLGEDFDSVIQKVRSSDFHPESYGKGVFFPTERGVKFPWHQEHTYYWNQTHRHYLHIFIPIIKPDASKGNLCIVPADNWTKKDPDIWKQIEWRGSMITKPDERNPAHSMLMDEWRDNCLATLPYTLDDIAFIPHLKAGDALLMRGDLFHRTQDADTARVALSVHVWCDSVPLSADHLQTSMTSSRFKERANKSFDWAAMKQVLTEHKRKQQKHKQQYPDEEPLAPLTLKEARDLIKGVQKDRAESNAYKWSWLQTFCSIF